MAQAHTQKKQHQNPSPGNGPHLAYSVFTELVLPFLYTFLTDHDPRSTFILSDGSTKGKMERPSLLYSNKAFHDLQRTCPVDIVQRCADLLRQPERPNPITDHESGLLVHFYSIQTTGLTGWFCFAEQIPILERVVESNYVEDDPGNELVYGSRGLLRLDWTRGWCPMAIHDSEHYHFIRSFDWSSTPLGPYTQWSRSLRAIVNAIMPLTTPTVIYYGKDAYGIYNAAWKSVVGARHPSILGVPLRQAWPDSPEYIYGILEKAMQGISTAEEPTMFLLKRTLESEESYFSFEFSPLIDDDGLHMGSLGSAIEHTDSMVKARRTKVTMALIEQTSRVKDLSLEGGFWEGVLEAFDLNPLGSPFAIIYRVEAWKICRRIGGRGLPDNANDIFTDYFDLELSPTFDGFFQRQFKDLSMQKKEYIVVEFTPQQLDELKGMQYRGFGTCKSAAVIPLYHGYGPPASVIGFLVLGLNDRRLFDDAFKDWLRELAQTLWKTVDIAWAKQEEARIRREQSASVKIKTEEMVLALQKTTQELKESELLFARTADVIPVGLVCLDAIGSIIYSNDAWHELCFLPRGEPKDSWPKIIYSGDRDMVVSTFTDTIVKKSFMSMELRLGNDDTPGSKGWLRWCRNSITPNFDEATGQLTGFVGTVIDITAAKDAAEYQRQLTIEAVESKRQQDNFIDVTCHELRNPLSAILQSADEITQLLKSLTLISGTASSQSTLLGDVDQAASTIFACGEHQKKIIDDILNMSKMDAGLLAIEPVATQPHVVLQKVMKMFEPEFKAKGITNSFELEEGYFKHCEGRWWSLDPARLTQITMNLVTNAVKFTATKDGIRDVRVSLDASTEPPDFKDNFQSSEIEAGTLTAQSSPSPTPAPPPHRQRTGSVAMTDPLKVIYLLVCVKDTGIGISKEWRAVMGQRYRQAPKTHISYGGSGLGLFIARQLAFLLGGELHFDSEVGVGSTFSFYIRCEQCTSAEDGWMPVPSPSSLQSTLPSGAAAPFPAANMFPPPSTHNPFPPKRGAGMRVLVVEDNIINQTILRRQLEMQGCRVDVASNGVEALEAIVSQEQSPFTVVLMDMEMPVMGGVATTQQIRATEQAVTSGRRHIPIIGTSANARMEHINQMLHAGMDDVMRKPFIVKDLMSKIEHVLRVGVTTSARETNLPQPDPN